MGAFAADVFQRGDGTLEALLTAPTAFVSGALGWLYGVPDPTGAAPERRALDPARRAGLLTGAAFLARHGNTHESHPVRRGKVVFERVLCGEVHPPPPSIPQVKPPAADVTTRERYAQHARDPFCAGCHEDFDALGFAFEHYDGIGSFRERDGEKPVDASGEVTLAGGQTRRFRDAVELASILARSDDARRCVARQWFRYALARREAAAEASALAAIDDAFARSGHDLRALVVAVARSSAFLAPRPPVTEAPR